MILKNIEEEKKQKELLKEIDMRQYRDDMQEIVYLAYGDEIEKEVKKTKELKKKYEEEIESIKTQLKKLDSMEDLNTPQARQLLHALIVQK